MTNMTKEITLPYARFSEITDLELEGVAEVGVSLGCAEFARRDIPKDAGDFPVYLSLKTPNGRYLGNGAYAGMVYGLDQDILEQLWQAAGAELDEDQLYLSAGCNEGDWLDDRGEAVCSECLAAAGEWHDPDSSEYDPESEDYDPDAPPASTPNPKKGCVCWSCKQMFDESAREAASHVE